MAVIAHKEEKVAKVFEIYGKDISEDEFKSAFIKEYPKEWEKINKTYAKEERNTKPGKNHPMPEPDTYLHNTYKVYKSKV
ncbi:MAG: hypothetical protein PHF63_06880 [Herbinix sp.]|nr:hypothetical protein [Herbinix sp.]